MNVRAGARAAAALLALSGVAACAQGGAAGSGDLARTLEAHRWTLDAATDSRGARLDALFPGKDGRFVFAFSGARLSVTGGCNTLAGGYELTPARELKAGRLAATMKACEPALMQADGALSKLLAGPLRAEVTEGAQPRLRLVSAAGETLSLTGAATPESRYGAGTTMFLEVAAAQIPCNPPLMPNATCLQVRERRFDQNGLPSGQPGAWRPLYETIEGYTHQAGVRNVLRVKRYTRSPVPADASAYVYVLDLVVESETVAR
jgi:heat shock protein HslJ